MQKNKTEEKCKPEGIRTIDKSTAQKRLAIIWIGNSSVLFIFFLFRLFIAGIDDITKQEWNWLLPNIMPSLSLIIAVFIAKDRDPDQQIEVERFVFYLAFYLSSFYFLALYFVILAGPITPTTPLELFKESNILLGPLQGLTSGALGFFFVNKPKQKKPKRRRAPKKEKA